MNTKTIVVHVILALVIFAVGVVVGKAKVYHKIKASDGYGTWQLGAFKDGKSGYPDIRDGKNADYSMGKGMIFDETFDGDMMVVEVMAIDASGMTVRSGGDMVTVNISIDTKIIKLPEGNLSDLRVGDMVTVIGTTSDDGVVDAERIHVRP